MSKPKIICLLAAIIIPPLSGHEGDQSFQFMPEANIMMEAACFGSNQPDYSGTILGTVDIDVFRIGKTSIGMSYNGEVLFGGKGRDANDPYNLRHRIKYVDIRYDMDRFAAGLYYLHTCDNGFEREGGERAWDLVVVEFQTQNMRHGHENDFIGFSSNNDMPLFSRFGYRVSFGSKSRERSRELEAAGDLVLRWDITRYRNQVPYIQFKLHPIWGEGLRWDYSAEIGNRINSRSAYLSPFMRYGFVHDLDMWQGESEHFIAAGFKIGTHRGNVPSETPYRFLPEMKMRCRYGALPGADDFEYNGEVTFDMRLFQEEHYWVYLDTDVEFTSPDRKDRPRFCSFYLEPGLGFDLNGYVCEAAYSHTARFDVNASDGYTEHGGLLFCRYGTPGMQTGHMYDGKELHPEKTFIFLNSIDWAVYAGKYIHTVDFDYDFKTGAGARWDILRYKQIIPYLAGNIDVFIGEHTDTEYYIETGVRFKGTFDTTLFIRSLHRENIDRFQGYADDYLLVGFRFE
jgi:hypothetical protein